MANGGHALSKSFSGCWTCRLRHKKCDETRPSCANCDTFEITCYYGSEKPEWMDGATKQQRLHEQIKSQIRVHAQRRRDQLARFPLKTQVQELNQSVSFPGPTCSFTRTRHPLSAEDVVLATYYMDRIFPTIFPFYDPPALSGGRSWLLELVSHSQVMRKVVVFQSSTLMLEELNASYDNRTLASQAEDLFAQLRAAVNVITQSSIRAHIHGAARVLACILQVIRFVGSLTCYSAGQVHFNAAVALTKGIIECTSLVANAVDYAAIWQELGPSLSFGSCSIPSAEQAAFKFALALLTADDILFSTIRGKLPDLLHYHDDLLGSKAPILDLSSIIGCESWVFLLISRINVLDSASYNGMNLGNLSIQARVERAMALENELSTRLSHFEVLDNLTRHGKSLATEIWAIAAFIYLDMLRLSASQSNTTSASRVDRILELLESLQSRQLIRNMTWPFFVAGCSCGLAHQQRFRDLLQDLKPRTLFGNLHVALQRLETVWQDREIQQQPRIAVNLWRDSIQSSILFV